MRRTPLVIAFLALALLGAPCARADDGDPAPAAKDDETLAAQARSLLEGKEGLESVTVEVEGGVAVLEGHVASDELLQQAQRLVDAIDGVNAVDNRIERTRDVREIAPAFERATKRIGAFVAFLPLLGLAIVIVLVFWLAGVLLTRLDWPFRAWKSEFAQRLAQQLTRFAFVVAGLVVALDILDWTALVGAVLGAAGLVGLVIGFAFRDLVENYVSGVLLSVRQPFMPGDHVVIEGHEGKIIRLTSRAMILRTLDGNHLRIPNAIVFKGIILNYTRNPNRRFAFDVGIGTGEGVTQAQRLAAATVGAMDGVLDDPPPFATVEQLGDWSVVLRVHGWVDQRQADFVKVASEAKRLVKRAFDEAGIEMPEPIQRARIERFSAPQRAQETRDVARAQPAGALDLAPRHHLDEEIAAERRQEKDLLNPEGLQE